MSILTVKNVNHGFGDRKILEDVSFRLLKGDHVGLIGANGEGKSTFMNIITRKLIPDEGIIEWSKKVRVGLLDQHSELEKGLSIKDTLRKAFQYLYDMEEEVNSLYSQMAEENCDMDRLMEEAAEIQTFIENSDFYLIDSKIEEAARGLGLTALGLDKDVNDLSGGNRAKILLCKLLLEKPDVMLLDEPTNFLDEEHILWLKDYLLKYENAFILISHDTDFINNVVNLIYHVENSKITRYVGDYDEFLRLYEQSKRQNEAAYERQQAEISDLKDFIARNKARVATANMAKSRQKKLDKMDIIEKNREKPKPEFNFKEARTPERVIFEAKDLVVGYDEPLTKPLNLLFERGNKVAVTGSNGIGKTTLLKSLMAMLEPVSGKVETGHNLFLGYFEQEIKEQNRNSCIDELWAEFPSYTQYEIRSALAKCGLTTQQLESKVYVLSGGEQAKVRLCKILNRETNVLILDEPTNHLDVDAKEALKKALISYKGSILMVCHEPAFYNDIVSQVWNLGEYSLKID